MIYQQVLIPKTVNELLPLLNNDKYRLSAGCTDIIPGIKGGKLSGKPIISLSGLEEIRDIYEKDNAVYIGANVSLKSIIENSIIINNFPLLVSALETIGSPQIRNRATLGGNVQNASPSGDGILALTILEAGLVLRSEAGIREISVDSFIQGVGRTALKNNEFIEYIVIPKASKSYKAYYEKVGLRSAMIIAVASAAFLYSIENNVISHIRIGLGAVSPKILRIREAEEFLKGKALTREVLEEAGELVGKAVSPIDDLRASAEYRRTVCKNLILRLLEL